MSSLASHSSYLAVRSANLRKDECLHLLNETGKLVGTSQCFLGCGMRARRLLELAKKLYKSREFQGSFMLKLVKGQISDLLSECEGDLIEEV